MKLTIADLVKAKVLQGVEKKEGAEDLQCPICGYHCVNNGGIECIRKADIYSEQKAFNQAIDTLYSQELDLGKLFDVEKMEKIILDNGYDIGGCGLGINSETLAEAICDKAAELVKEEK
uniref:Uncharacterized protein n=1 Tax=viral metagenome TaxID=1070528 RepID=A0A6M3KYR9_9ZZZZ